MRTLEFILDKQILRKDPKCDYRNLILGTKGYLSFHFSFSKDWDGCNKAIQFLDKNDHEIDAFLLDDSDSITIPDEIAALQAISFRVHGVKNGYLIISSVITVYQKEG